MGIPMSDECRLQMADSVSPSVQVGDTARDKYILDDLGKFVHHILKDDDTDTIESKEAFNSALISSAELQIAHREALNFGSVAKIEELWDLRSSSHQEEIDILRMEHY